MPRSTTLNFTFAKECFPSNQQIQPLKNIRLSLYWKGQLAGWSAIIYYISDVLVYIPITHQYRNLALRKGWNILSLKGLVKVLIPAIAILGLTCLAVTILKSYWLRIWLVSGCRSAGRSVAYFFVLCYSKSILPIEKL